MPQLNKYQHAQIVDLYMAGKTLPEVGRIFGVSGERVRQILKTLGVKKEAGGGAVKAAIRKAALQQAKDAKCIDKYGCTEAQFFSAKGHHTDGARSPLYAFLRQRAHAKIRGVEWRMTFWQWWGVWSQSGKWESRGRAKRSFVMCRHGDIGAYEEGNVFIGTCESNSVDGRTLAWERGGKRAFNYRVIRAAGGRKAVAEALGYPPQYISQVGVLEYFPPSWKERGPLKVLADMTAGAYSESDLEKSSCSETGLCEMGGA